jgi:arylsulfatase A-like enzyme
LGIGDDSLDGRSLLPNLRGEKLAQSREEIFLEFHGIRFLYSQRAVVTRDGWKYIFTPGDQDEAYNLNEDPGELVNLLGIAEHADKIEELRDRMMRCAIATDDPLERGISKFFGHWRPPGERSEPSMF